MSAITTDLMGSGVPSAQARLLGLLPVATIAGSGTAQKTDSAAITASNLLPEQGLVLVTTAGGQTAVQIPSTMPLGAEIRLMNTSATAALLYPPSGGAINGGSGDASLSVAQNKPTVITRASSTVFMCVIGA